MAKPWKDVIASEQYQTLSGAQKAAAQEQYFNSVVAPKVSGGKVEAARSQFFTQFPTESKSEPKPKPKPESVAIPEPAKQIAKDLEPKLAPDAAPEPKPTEEPGFLDKIKELVTGDERSTPEIDRLDEIGSAPELNEFSSAAAKASLGLMTQFDVEGMRGVIAQQFPNSKFATDEKGNIIVELPSGRYALDKPGMSAQDVAKILFGLSTGAAGGAAVGARTGAAGIAATGATEGGINLAQQAIGEQLGGKGIDIQEVVASAALGVGAKGIEDLIGTLRKLKAGDLTDSQKQLLELAEKEDLSVLTSDVLPPKTFVGKSAQQIAEKVPVVGTGVLREQQEDARQALVKRFTESFAEPNYDQIIQSLKGKKELKKRRAGKVLEKVGNQLDQVGPIEYGNTAGAALDVTRELNKPGVLKSPEALSVLDEFKKTITEAPQTFSSLKENRTKLAEKLRSQQKGERSQLPPSEQRLLQKVVNGLTKDMETMAKQNLSPEEFQQWKKANKTYGEEAEILRTTKVKNVLDKGDLTPEVVDTMLFSKKPSEVRLLYKQLGKDGRQNARAAIIQRVLSGRDVEEISPTVFNNKLKSMSTATKVFFQGDDGKALKGLQTLLDTTRRAPEAAVATATGQQAVPLLAGAAVAANAANAILGASVGAFAKAYEGKTVRNALLKLANTPKNSDKFQQNLSAANDVLRNALQVELRRQQGEDNLQESPQ